jgi:hypothetical protein
MRAEEVDPSLDEAIAALRIDVTKAIDTAVDDAAQLGKVPLEVDNVGRILVSLPPGENAA